MNGNGHRPVGEPEPFASGTVPEAEPATTGLERIARLLEEIEERRAVEARRDS
jgi:hypothetical protein